ncbi:TlpA family protein disulfide reductase [Acidobacteria bacterium AH-259-L09]|nr:TlpA family protein disulfide reductase [Acidobacteria bacterium AH-259-L09]
MRRTVLILLLLILMTPLLAPLLAQSSIERKVLETIQKMIRRDGRVIFSDLYNSEEFNTQEKAFLGRLYETFFRVPAFLKSEYESSGKIPTRQEIAAGLGISPQAVDLLLTVIELDPRVPPLFERNPQSKEIESLKLDNIEAFIRSQGTEVKITQWEGNPLPAFELMSFQGKKISHQDLAGKNLLIYFWFTGCPPCVRIAPILADLERRYSRSNFQVIGFNADRILGLDTTDREREDYLRKHELNFANIHLDRATRKAFGNVNVFPTLFLVRTDGTIFRHLVNFQNRETLERIIAELIGAH